MQVLRDGLGHITSSTIRASIGRAIIAASADGEIDIVPIMDTVTTDSIVEPR